VQPLEPYRLMLRFEDGAEGVIDVHVAPTWTPTYCMRT
jgi:hypothetical protein